MSYDSLARDRLTYAVTVLEPLYNQYAQSGFTDRARAEQFFNLSYKWGGEIIAQKLFSDDARAQIDDGIERQLDGEFDAVIRRAAAIGEKFGFSKPSSSYGDAAKALPGEIVKQAEKLGNIAQDAFKWLLPIGAVLVVLYLVTAVKK